MKNYLIRIILYSCIALVPVSCGSRKVSTAINKSTVDSVSKAERIAVVKKEETKTDYSNEKNKSVKSEEKQEERTTELYFDNGILKSRVIEKLNSKNTDTHLDSKIYIKSYKINLDSVFTTKTYRKVSVSNYSKNKDSKASNTQLYWAIFGVGVFAIMCYFLYRYFRG